MAAAGRASADQQKKKEKKKKKSLPPIWATYPLAPGHGANLGGQTHHCACIHDAEQRWRPPPPVQYRYLLLSPRASREHALPRLPALLARRARARQRLVVQPRVHEAAAARALAASHSDVAAEAWGPCPPPPPHATRHHAVPRIRSAEPEAEASPPRATRSAAACMNACLRSAMGNGGSWRLWADASCASAARALMHHVPAHLRLRASARPRLGGPCRGFTDTSSQVPRLVYGPLHTSTTATPSVGGGGAAPSSDGAPSTRPLGPWPCLAAGKLGACRPSGTCRGRRARPSRARLDPWICL